MHHINFQQYQETHASLVPPVFCLCYSIFIQILWFGFLMSPKVQILKLRS